MRSYPHQYSLTNWWGFEVKKKKLIVRVWCHECQFNETRCREKLLPVICVYIHSSLVVFLTKRVRFKVSQLLSTCSSSTFLV